MFARSLLVLCLLVGLAVFEVAHSYGVQGRLKVPSKPKCLYFTGAGVFLMWQIGAAKYLKENCNLDNIEVAGASAGSLTAAILLSDADFDKAVEVALTQGIEDGVYEKSTGLAGSLGRLLFQWLNTIIPDDDEEKLASSLERLTIALTPPLKQPYLCSGFTSKAELVEACMASCHIPFFIDGKIVTKFRGEAVIDGSFWYFVTKDRFTGLPLPKHCDPEDILWVDYGDDEEFMARVSGSFLSLQSTEAFLQCVESGFNFMKREHYSGRLPLARNQLPAYYYTSLTKVRAMAAQYQPEILQNSLSAAIQDASKQIVDSNVINTVAEWWKRRSQDQKSLVIFVFSIAASVNPVCESCHLFTV